MRTWRRGPVAGAACSALLLASPALGAAPAPACPQLVDARGDQSPATDPAADLRSLALRADSRSLTLVVGYQDEQVAATPLSGHIYMVELETAEAGALDAWAFIAPSGNTFSLYRRTRAGSASAGTHAGRPTGQVDTRRHTVTMTIPFALAPDVLRLRQSLTVTASASTALMTPPLEGPGRVFASETSDEGDAPARYRVGARGC